MKIDFIESKGKISIVGIDEIKSAHLLISRPIGKLPKQLNIQTKSGIIISVDLNDTFFFIRFF